MPLRTLEKSLSRHRLVDEFVVLHRRSEKLEAKASGERRRWRDEEVSLTVFRDFRELRGQGSVVAESVDDVDDALIGVAAERAALSVGPLWVLPPPAAPARVETADPAILEDMAGSTNKVLQQFHGARSLGNRIADLRVRCSMDEISIATSTGLRASYTSTLLEIVPVIGALPLATRLASITSRRLPVDVASTLAEIAPEVTAIRTPSGPHDLVLRPHALLGGIEGSAFGWFAPLVAQADARRHRSGLTRYRQGQNIVDDRPTSLTIVSDGTIAFAPLTRPFDSQGGPTRKFDIVRDGRSTGLATSVREAALSGIEPNGGVRNLSFEAGTLSEGELLDHESGRPVLEVNSVSWLEIDPMSGTLTASVAAGRVHGSEGQSAVTGGIITGNLFDFLSRARLSGKRAERSWYGGPDGFRIDNVAIA